MKKCVFLLLIATICFGCSENNKSNHEKGDGAQTAVVDSALQKNKPLVSNGKNGQYKEWYPGHKQLKIEGRKMPNGNRAGIWTSYFPNGVKQSIEQYGENGQSNGFYMINYPNGMPRIIGKFNHGKKVGVWKIKDKKGNLVRTIDYTKK